MLLLCSIAGAVTFKNNKRNNLFAGDAETNNGHKITRQTKINIFYSVEEKSLSLEENFKFLLEELKTKRSEMEKVIIFCNTLRDCSDLYLYFKSVLRQEMTDPVGYPLITQFKLVEMFTACNSQKVKSDILKEFASDNSRLRLVIASVAFGMGLDCKNVSRIFHWGPPSGCEMYIQETGRAGRNGERAFATLYYSKRYISHSFIEPDIIEYCKNNYSCRRETLFKDFGYSLEKTTVIGCTCCDVCMVVCECSKCKFSDMEYC